MNSIVVMVFGMALLTACSRAGGVAPPAELMPAMACRGGHVMSNAGLGRYGMCSSIAGDLVIEGVSDLSPLARARFIAGTLWIQNTAELDSLSGLERLDSVSRLLLTNNRNLDDISALSSLHDVGSLVLTRNPSLGNLDGLSALHTLDRLTIVENGLHSLRGLENLRRVRRLTISRNPFLIDIGALNQVADAETIRVEHNPRIAGWFGVLRGLQGEPVQATFRNNAGLGAFEWPSANEDVAAK